MRHALKHVAWSGTLDANITRVLPHLLVELRAMSAMELDTPQSDANHTVVNFRSNPKGRTFNGTLIFTPDGDKTILDLEADTDAALWIRFLCKRYFPRVMEKVNANLRGEGQELG